MSLRMRVLAISAMLAMIAGCGDSAKDKPASQTAARVNKEEITVHQINFLLRQQRGLAPEQAASAAQPALERLIDQELALQKALELKLDRSPAVVQQLEAIRREVIARAYIERLSEGAPKPTPEEVKQYYASHPALFKERRVYNLQELAIEAAPEQIETLKARLDASKDIGEFVAYLNTNGFKFIGNQAVRAAEQLPLGSLEAFARMKDGEAVLKPTPTGAQVVVLAGSRVQPVDEAQARPAVEQFLLNESKRRLVEEDLKALRSAADIQYVGEYAKWAGKPSEVPSAAPSMAASAATAEPGGGASDQGLKGSK